MKLLKRITTILLLPLLLIGGTNYLVDPDYTLRKDYIPTLANALNNGKMVSGPVNINSRLLKKQWIIEMEAVPEVLVLGSSRTLSLSGEAFPGKTFFNASVTNCTFQDMYVFLNLFEKKDKLPGTIVICADQWLFGDQFIEKRWLLNRKEFEEMAEKVGGISSEDFPSKWELDKEWVKELFSIRYLIRSLKYRGKAEKFEVQTAVVPNKMMFLPDGSRHLPDQLTGLSEKEVAGKAVNYFYSSPDEYFTELDSLQCRLFESLVMCLQSKGCDALLFIPSYHPETCKLLKHSAKTTGVFEAEKYVLDFAQKHQLKTAGRTNPADINLEEADFYDAVHLKPEVLMRVFENHGTIN